MKNNFIKFFEESVSSRFKFFLMGSNLSLKPTRILRAA